MGLNGGGYTFIHPKDLPYLTNEEIQALYTDKYSFLMRVRRADSTQAYGVLQQMTTYQYELHTVITFNYAVYLFIFIFVVFCIVVASA